MSDLMIVKVIDAVNIPADRMEHLRKEIMKQKETGVIVLPWFLTAIVVPEDTEIKVERKEEDEDESGDNFFEMLNASEKVCNVNGEELKVMG